MNFGDAIKSGKDPVDTWKRMLMQYRDISEDRAIAIIGAYPTVSSLWTSYYNCACVAVGESLLADLQVNHSAKISTVKTVGG